MFPILEAMSDGAVKVGIPREISLKMAAQTMKGAAELLLQEKVHPGVLKDAVCSPGQDCYTYIFNIQYCKHCDKIASKTIELILFVDATSKYFTPA